MSLVLSNKVLTWENAQTRNWDGPNRCVLCKQDCESVDHLFVNCSFSRSVWREVLLLVNSTIVWNQGTLLDSFQFWISDKAALEHRALPRFALWGL